MVVYNNYKDHSMKVRVSYFKKYIRRLWPKAIGGPFFYILALTSSTEAHGPRSACDGLHHLWYQEMSGRKIITFGVFKYLDADGCLKLFFRPSRFLEPRSPEHNI